MYLFDIDRNKKVSYRLLILFQLYLYCLVLVFISIYFGIFPLIAISYLILLNGFALHTTATCSPGVLKKNKMFDYQSESLYFSDGISATINIIEDTRIISFPDSKQFVQKFCMVCNCFRPLGSAHCTDCDSCILEKDHHCLLMMTCIGRNNLRCFCSFIFTEGVLSFLAGIMIYINRNVTNKLIRNTILILCSLHTILGLFLISLFIYYVVLAIFGMTSREFINGNLKFRTHPNGILGILRKKEPIGVL